MLSELPLVWAEIGLMDFFDFSVEVDFILMLTLAQTERRKGEVLIQLDHYLHNQNNNKEVDYNNIFTNKEVDFDICLFMGQVNYCMDK